MENNNIKICPHCGASAFAAMITRPCVVQVKNTTGEDNSQMYEVINESKTQEEINIIKCMKCKKDVTEKELVLGVKCSQCGNIMPYDEIDESGVCVVCAALSNRSELMNASKEDLIRMLLEAEKKNSSIVKKIDKKEEEAENAVSSIKEKKTRRVSKKSKANTANVQDNSTEQTSQNAENTEDIVKENIQDDQPENIQDNKPENIQEFAPEAMSVPENVPAPEAVLEEEQSELINNIAESQESPFPDMFPPEEVDNIQGFNMYEDESGESF